MGIKQTRLSNEVAEASFNFNSLIPYLPIEALILSRVAFKLSKALAI